MTPARRWQLNHPEHYKQNQRDAWKKKVARLAPAYLKMQARRRGIRPTKKNLKMIKDGIIAKRLKKDGRCISKKKS